MPVRLSVTATDGAARAGVLKTPHGDFETPGFIPVGTRAAVRAMASEDLRAVGAQTLLANTYHLMLRPGAEIIADLGGLHSFMGWDGPILTDSGGFQIFSLEPKITEDAALFRSTYDGTLLALSPEKAVTTQEQLGADIAMVLDVCVALPAQRATVEAAMHRTLRWAERSQKAHSRADQALFGIVQGGIDPELRAESARATAALGFAGFGIGGLSVGEPPEERNVALAAAVAELPADKVRYVMGLGDTKGVLDAVERGSDMFDCVLPTRLARHGKVLSPTGSFNIRRSEFRADPNPLQEDCPCSTCATYSRAYLRHLVNTGELTSMRLLSVHNLTYTLGLLRDTRQAISQQRFRSFRKELLERLRPADVSNGRDRG